MSIKNVAEREADVKVISDLGKLKDQCDQMKVFDQLEQFKDNYYQRDIW